MKKIVTLCLCVLAALTLVGCTKEVETATAKYDFVNVTGGAVDQLYVYEVGSEEKGDNYAATPIENNGTVTVTFDLPADEAADKVYVVEYKMQDTEKKQYEVQTFDTLHFEEASIYLQSLDAAAGATNISFSEPEYNGVYTFVNTTGKTVDSLYVYESGSADKGENYAEGGLAAEATVVVTKTELATARSGKVYVIEFTAEGGEPQTFDTLHFETATINLLSVDEAAGATQIKFGW